MRSVHDTMSRGSRPIRYSGGLVLALALLSSGCVAPDYGERSWTNGFDRTMLSSPTSDTGRANSPRAIAITPRRCQARDAGNALLAPGCANDLNLARMVARPRDLIRGRTMGPPRATPVARAAESAIDASGKRTAKRNAAVRQQAQSEVTSFGLP